MPTRSADEPPTTATPGGSRPGPPGGRGAQLAVLVSTLVVALGAGVLAVVLTFAGPDAAPDAAARDARAADVGVPGADVPGAGAPAPPGPPATPGTAPGPEGGAVEDGAELPVPRDPTGTATLSDPTITVAKNSLSDAEQWCSLLTAADVRAVTGFEQRGIPDGTLLCTHYLADDAGHLFVSDIPASAGALYAVRGNSAIVYQSSPAACEVTVALNRAGGVLDVDLRGIVSPRVPLCQAAANLAARAFDRLPAAG